MTERAGFQHAEEVAEHQVGLEPTEPLARQVGVNLWTGNLVGAVLTLGLGTYMIVSAFGFGFGAPSKPGAGLFPALIGGVLVLLGAIWLSQTLLGHVRREDEPSRLDRGGVIKITVTIAVVLSFALLVDLLGYQLTMLAAVAALLTFVAKAKWWVTIIIAVVFSFGTFTLFDYALGVPMPVSELPFLQQIGL